MVTTRAKFKRTQNIPKTLVSSSDDLLTEILRRLPAKSILRFKSVSKHWLPLLSTRRFTLLLDKLSISPGFFFDNLYIPFDVENQSTPPFRSLSFCHDIHGIRIVQSCNGLLLCCSDAGKKRTRKYYVFNPTTKQFAVSPPVKGDLDVRTNVNFMGLAFHQTNCVHYKIVSVYRVSVPVPYLDTDLYKIQIYSSDTGKWRISCQSFPLSVHSYFYNYGVYWNGAIHWATRCSLFYFKLDVDHLQKLPLPDYFESGAIQPYSNLLYFGKSRGHMHLVQTADQESRLHLNVYEMMSDHSAWFIKYHVELDAVPNAYPEDLKILDVVRGEKEEDTFMVVKICRKIITYSILDKSFKLIFDLYGSTKYGKEVHRYIESIGSF